MTHAFFKALLFLAAGLVIHHLAGEQDIRQMGGAAALMPQTYSRVPRRLARARRDPAALGLLLEGLDPRLGAGRTAATATVLFAAGLVGAFLTGLYTFRLYFIVFGGEPSAARAASTPTGTGTARGRGR